MLASDKCGVSTAANPRDSHLDLEDPQDPLLLIIGCGHGFLSFQDRREIPSLQTRIRKDSGRPDRCANDERVFALSIPILCGLCLVLMVRVWLALGTLHAFTRAQT